MAFEPNNITKEHIKKAIARIKSENIELIPSTRWDVLIDNERFPPKDIMRLAHEEMNGERVWHNGGGYATNRYFEKMGYTIVEKDSLADPIKELIAKYKIDLQENELADEIYKWKLVNQYKGRPDLSAPDFLKEIKSINYSNLIYGVGLAVVYHLAKDRAEPYRECFKMLFDESLPLAERLEYFHTETLKLYRELVPEEKYSHHQDERTMATFLAFYNPDKYPFYKDSFYQKYCKLIGIKAKRKGEKYLHYLELLDGFISEYLEPDTELLDMVDSMLPEDAFKDTSRKILAQDILYRMLDGTLNPSQSEENALRDVLKKSAVEDLNVYFHILDRLIEELGIADDAILTFSTSEQLSFQIGIRYCLNLKVDKFNFIAPEGYAIDTVNKSHFRGKTQPSFIHEASADEVLQHYAAIKEAVQFELSNGKYSNKKKYDNLAFRKAAFDKDYRYTFFDFQEIDNMPVLSSTFRNNKVSVALNQILFGPPGTGKTYTTINKALEILGVETDGASRSELKKKFEERVAAGEIVFTTFHQSMSYEDFIEGIKPLEPKVEGHPVVYKVTNGILKELCDRIKSSAKLTEAPVQVVDTESFDKLYAAFLERLKSIMEDLDENESHVLPSRKSNVKLLKIDGNNILTTGESASSTETVSKEKIKRIYDQFSSPDEITNIVKQLRAVSTDIGWTTNYYAVFKALKDFENSVKLSAKQHKEAAPKKFILIIDEINRGNVSQIFGELITLIEEDKRLGRSEQLEVTLPYSKEKFGVPANLYIIGTMNTADRSVEALDTALRRRFSFVEMPPRYDLQELEESVEGYPLKNLLLKINRRIGKLLSKDNLIGHSYFLGIQDAEGLRKAFQNKIIPLLQEYFYGDYGKIGLVLGEGFFKTIEDNDDDVFASFGSYDASGLAEKEVYHLAELIGENRLNDREFGEALHALMK